MERAHKIVSKNRDTRISATRADILKCGVLQKLAILLNTFADDGEEELVDATVVCEFGVEGGG